jgi:hypothetical protein
LTRTQDIRTELLKRLGEGNSPSEINKILQEKFHLSKAGCHYHWETYDKWIADYSDVANNKRLLGAVLQRYNYVYRSASFQFLQCSDHNGRVGYLKVMLDATKALHGFIPGAESMTANDIVLSWNLDKYKDGDILNLYKPIEDANGEPKNDVSNT